MGSFIGFEKITRQQEPLARHTWFHLGGPAEYFIQPGSVDELAAVVRRCHETQTPVRLLGGGSNILARDEGVSGAVIHLAGPAFSEIDVQDQVVSSGAGAKLGHVISTAVRHGLAGLEMLVGIPGTVGGALRGNAGSRSGDIGQWTCRATVMNRTGEIQQREREDLVFAYRQSSLDELVILGAQIRLEPDDPEDLTKRMQKQWIIKKAAQPLSHQSAGCIFKNPRGMSAGMLIDQCGLKGALIGQAEVSERHANFIVTAPGATSQDVLALIDLVKTRVSERLGIELELEIEVW